MAYESGNDRKYESRDYAHKSNEEAGVLRPKDIKSPDLVREITIGGSALCYPIVHNGVCYFGANDKYFYALSAKDGEEIWRFLTGGIILSGASIYDGVVYFGSADNYIYALSASDGKLLWKFRTGNGIISTPVKYKKTIYVGSSDGYLYALDEDGQMEWKFRTGGSLSLGVAISNNRIYFGSFDSHLYAINTNGDFLWRFRTGGGIFCTPSISDRGGYEIWSKFDATPMENKIISEGLIFFGSYDGNYYALSTDGELLWRYQTGGSGEGTGSLFNKKLYFGGWDGYARCLSLKGEELWKKKAGEIAFAPNVVDGVVYFGSADHNIRALSAEDGELLWMYRTNGFNTTAPFIENGVVYFGSWDGYFYCVKKGELIWRFRTSLEFPSQIRNMVIGPKARRVMIKNIQEKEEASYVRTLSDGGIRIATYAPIVPYKIGAEYASRKKPYMP